MHALVLPLKLSFQNLLDILHFCIHFAFSNLLIILKRRKFEVKFFYEIRLKDGTNYFIAKFLKNIQYPSCAE